MHAGALRALEFDRIVEAVRRFALTPTGAARLDALQPPTEPRRSRALAATTETVALPRRTTGVSAARAGDLDEVLGLARGRGTRARAAAAAGAGRISRFDRDAAARPSAARAALPDPAGASSNASRPFAREIAAIRRKIDAGGEVVDDASPELRRVRDRLRKQRARLRGTLESYLRGKDTSKYLQEQIVTDRNGRYVLVVQGRAPQPRSRDRARQLGQRREPVSRAAQHGRDQQRHRRARAAGSRGSPAHPARADRCASARGRATCARRPRVATELDVLQAKARLAAVTGAVSRRPSRGRPSRAARRAPPAADARRRVARTPTIVEPTCRMAPVPVDITTRSRRRRRCSSPGRTPAARPWRSRRPACSR